jgi:hypothetical protein
MKKFLFLCTFFTLAAFASLDAQNLTIKIPKSYNGATNEKIWLIPVGQTSTGADAVKSMVDPTDDGTHWVYTMTSSSNITKVNNFLNASANNRYRVYYHSFNVAGVSNTSNAQIGNFKKTCKVGNIITIAAVGQTCL